MSSSSATELRAWLNRPEQTFCANLSFGIKAWRSIEFVLVSKHEIIAEEFCRNLPTLRKELKKTSSRRCERATATAEAWSTVCEFLALKYPAGAIGSTVKQQLVDVLRNEAHKTKDVPFVGVFEALLLTLHNTAMQNFYKSSPDALADLIGTICAYLLQLIEHQTKSSSHDAADDWLPKQSEAIGKLLSALLTFVKQTPMLEVFRKRFACESYVPLVELIIVLKSKGLNYTNEFFCIINAMFFPVGAATVLQDFLKASASSISTAAEHSEFVAMFTAPSHALALWLESILKAFRLDILTQIALHEFLFAHVFVNSATDPAADSDSVAVMLSLVTHYLNLLKLHDGRMTATLSSKRSVTQFFAQHIETLFDQHHSVHLSEMLSLLCAVLRLDGNMLDKSMILMAAKCMLLPKTDALTEHRFAQFLCSVIDTFRRLNKASNFVAHLLRHLGEQLAETKLSSRLKRKSLAMNGKAVKKSKQNGGGDANVTLNGDTELLDDENGSTDYFGLLQAVLNNDSVTDAAASNMIATSAAASDWPDIAFAWPAAVGEAFVQFIGGLVSRPSLVVWKTVLCILTDYVVLIKEGHSDSSSMFLVDLAAALLCQYFAGARLAEHSDQIWEPIDANRKLTHSLLHEFGKAILHKEHNNRTMNAFLKCCLHVTDFELLCFYYWPDTMTAEFDSITGGAAIHPYLQEPPQQWTLVEQRITNFGRDECRANLNRLQLQRIYGAALFGRQQQRNSNIAVSDAVLLADAFQVQRMLGGQAAGLLVDKLSVSEMRDVCELLTGSEAAAEILARLSGRVLRNGRFVFVLCLHVYNATCGNFGSTVSTKAPFAVDCDAIVGAMGTKETAAGIVAQLVKQLQALQATGGHLKKANALTIGVFLDQLHRLPTDFLAVEERNVLFVLLMSLYVGAKKTQSVELIASTLRLLRSFLYFGTPAEVFDVLPISDWLKVFGGDVDVLPLYRRAFEKAAAHRNEANIRMFDELLALLCNENDDPKQNLIHLDVSLALLDSLTKEKIKCKDHLAKYRGALLARIQQELMVAEDSENVEAVPTFVRHTVGGFAVVIGAVISRVESHELIDDKVRAMFKVYVQHAALSENFAAVVKLLNFVVRERKLLQLSEDEERVLMDRHWGDYVSLLQEGRGDRGDGHAEHLLKFLLTSKTAEEFVELLYDGGRADAEDTALETFCAYRHKLFAGIAKGLENKTSGILFTEFFKHIALCLMQALRKRGPLLDNSDAILKMLECQRLICINVKLPMSVQLVDDILAFLSEIDIKSYASGISLTKPKTKPTDDTIIDADTRLKSFVRLHSAMSGVLQVLVQHRFWFVLDRIAHIGGIVRELLHALVVYQSQPNAQPNAIRTGNSTPSAAVVTPHIVQTLDKGAVTMLADLMHRMANLIKAFVKHAKDVQRVAPYLLLSTINLLVSDEQPASTTVNVPQIKTHLDGICFDLISVCDARVEGFLLRNCNEAAKQVFEQLNRDFNKYHKFRGKV